MKLIIIVTIILTSWSIDVESQKYTAFDNITQEQLQEQKIKQEQAEQKIYNLYNKYETNK